MFQYTLARGKFKSLEEIMKEHIINKRSLEGRQKGMSIDVTGRKDSSVDQGTPRRLNIGGYSIQYGMTLKKNVTRTNSHVK